MVGIDELLAKKTTSHKRKAVNQLFSQVCAIDWVSEPEVLDQRYETTESV